MHTQRLKNVFAKSLLVTALGLGLSACSVHSTKQSTLISDSSWPTPTTQSANSQQLKQLLNAEFTLQRQGGEEAFPLYLAAAQTSGSDLVSQRSTAAAIASDNNNAVLAATELWLTQNPKASQAYPVRFQALLVDEQFQQAQALLIQARTEEVPLSFLPAFVDQQARNIDATTQLQTILAASELEGALYVELAKTHLDFLEGKSQKILTKIDALIEQSPDNEIESLIVIKAFSLQKTGETELAQTTLEAGEQDYPDSQRIFATLLDIMIENGQTDKAIAKFESADLSPFTQQQIGLSMGQLLLQQGERQQSIQVLKQLPSRGGLSHQIHFILANAYHEDGQQEKALQTLTRVFGSLSWNASELLVKWLYENGQPERINSIIIQRTGLDDEPGHVIGVSDLHEQQQRPDLSLELLSAALLAFPNMDSVRYKRAITYDQRGQWQAAIKDLRLLAQKHPDDASYLNALGYTIMVRDPVNIDEAIDLIEQAYDLDPDDPAIIDSLGWAHYLRGELDTAAALLNQAWNTMEDAEIGAHYGEVLWQLGQQEQARRIWRTSLELNAQLPTLRQTLEKYEPTLLDQE